MKIRRAKIEDYNLMLGLFKELDAFHRNAHPTIVKPTNPKTRTKDWFKGIINDKSQFIYIGFDKNNPVGFIHFKNFLPNNHPLFKTYRHVYIYNILVTKKYRGQNIGRILYKKALNYSKKYKVAYIELGVWSFNQAAIKFYEELGFQSFSIKMRLNFK